jgi:hypothetical protein
VLTGGAQLAGGTAGEGLGTHVRQHLVGGPQLFTGVLAAALAAQPLAVDEVRAGEVSGDPAAPQVLNGLAVVLLGGRTGAGQCA